MINYANERASEIEQHADELRERANERDESNDCARMIAREQLAG